MLISPHMVLWGMPILVIYFPAWFVKPDYINDIYFNLIFTFGIIGSLIGSLIFKIPTLVDQNIYKEKIREFGYKTPILIIRFGAMVYFAFLILTIFFTISNSGGLASALKVGRVQAYLSGGILKGQTFQLLFILPKIMYYFYIGRKFEKKQYISAFLLVLTISVFYFFTANTRLPILFPIVAFSIIYLSMTVNKKLLPFLMPIFMISGVVIVFSFAVFASYLRTGTLSSFSNVTGDFFNAVFAHSLAQLKYYEWVHDLFLALSDGSIPYDYCKAWFYYGAISIFPRFLWPGKPITSTSNRLSESVMGITLGDGQLITTFSVFGEGFWQLSYVGALFSGFLLLAVYCIMIHLINKFRYANYWIVMLIINMAPFFRAEIPIPTFILNLIILSVLFVIKVNKRSNYSEINKS